MKHKKPKSDLEKARFMMKLKALTGKKKPEGDPQKDSPKKAE